MWRREPYLRPLTARGTGTLRFRVVQLTGKFTLSPTAQPVDCETNEVFNRDSVVNLHGVVDGDQVYYVGSGNVRSTAA